MTKKNFWVIDDDPVFQMIIQKLLMKVDFCGNVETSKNGMEAAEKLEDAISSPETLPDYIFLDINMPIMDGWQFLARFTDEIRKVKDDGPIVYIVTSSIDSKDKKAAEEHPLVEDYIVKPVSLEFIKSLRPPERPVILD